MCTQLSSNAACIMFHPTNKQSQVCCAIVQKRFFFVRHTRSFFSFFFSLSFFYFIFFPLCDDCLWADRETQSRCLRKIFFFLVGKHQIFETNKSSIESMFKARCRRTNDRVISDRWRCAIRQLYIRSCSTSNPIFLRSERARRIYGRFFFFSPLRLIFENNLTAGILVKVIFQYFDTKIPRNKIDPIIDYSFSLFHKGGIAQRHRVQVSRQHVVSLLS